MTPGVKIRGLRWWVVALLGIVTALNYFDRQTLALLAATLQKVWGVTTVQYSYITAAWLTSYTIMYAVSGRVIDYLGTRRGLGGFVLAWSAVDALHFLARTALQFSGCRFLLGAAEAANFPGGIKAVTEWFPVRERALAVGLFNSGTAIGAAGAAPIVAWIALRYGWRDTFLVGGALSAIWAGVWLATYRPPEKHPWITAEELALIRDGRPAQAVPPPVSLRLLLSTRAAWGCIAARAVTDPLSYLFAFWIPRFLQEKRGFDLATLGKFYWIPYLGLLLGNLAGGAIPDRLIRGGWSLDQARKSVMLAASLLAATCFILITRVPSPGWALGLIGGAMFCHAAWANMTLPAEVFPRHVVGTISGFAGAAGSLVSAVVMLLIGHTVKVNSYTPVFLAYAALPLLGFALVCLLIKQLGQIRQFPV